MSAATNGGAARRIITLRASDGEEFPVDEVVAMESQIVRGYFEDDKRATDEEVMTLPSVSGKNLAKIVRYCAGRVELRAEGATDEEIRHFNAKFLRDEYDEAVKELLVASSFMDVKDLEDVLCEAVAGRIRNKSVEFVRDFLGVLITLLAC